VVPNFDNCAKPFLTLVGEIQMYNTQSLPGSFGDRSPGIDGNRIGRYRLGNGIEAVGIDSVSVGNKIVQNLGIENVVETPYFFPFPFSVVSVPADV